ncbi:hypothetical protein BD779DRAFT_1663241 [Infundibulicybe gibba]|nr:hypothetical protein BD779DRAFT_1663241 [Infundibulicybe gibba]
MASKQLGKLRQWAGEVISSRDKTTVTDEFKELEKDIELRKDGAQRLLMASEAYHYTISKKKGNDALDDAEKLLPIDALGIVMIVHGEEFGDDSAFGTSLVKFGRAHCKVATLQEAFALTFQDTFISSIKKFDEDIKEYETQKKKLESRRLSYDAALSKMDKVKNSKKEKDRREADDEVERTRQRYEETEEDVRAQMHAIQDKETTQLRELSLFLDLEINYVEQYLSVLKDTKADWHDRVTKPSVPSRTPSRAAKNPTPSKPPSRSNSRTPVHDSSSDDTSSLPRSRRPSVVADAKSLSRPSSRASRKRSDSNGTVGGKEDKDKERERDKSRRLSVAGWASSAVGSVTGRGKKNKDKFAALGDDDGSAANGDGQDSPPTRPTSSMSRRSSKNRSKENLPSRSPKPPPRILKPRSLQEKKTVRALYDFSGSSDELSFRAGDHITVVNEVLDGWWMGELDGRQGLFPTPYTEPATGKPAVSSQDSLFDSEDDVDQQYAARGEYATSDFDDDLGPPPLTPKYSPFYGVASDTASITSSVVEEEERARLVPVAKKPANAEPQTRSILQPLQPSYSQPTINRWSATAEPTSSTTSPSKKPPPPPPPRRSTANTPSSTPPIPDRRPGYASTASSLASSHGYDTSPFESATEIMTASGPCSNFQQNLFKSKGMCNNCFQIHTNI